MKDMPSRRQLLRESWHRLGEFVPEMRRPWRVGLVFGVALVVCGLCLAGGRIVARASPYRALLVQSGFVLWAALCLYVGFWRHRAGYRERYGTLAHRYLFLRFFVPGLVGLVAAVAFPVLVGGKRLLPPAIAYSLAAYLLITMQLIVERGKEVFCNLDLRAFVYSVFPERGQVLTSGIFLYLRHPIYSSAMRLTFGLALLRNNAVALLCSGLIAAGFWLWTKAEERDLITQHADYEDYHRLVPAFFVTRPVWLVRFWRFLVTGQIANGSRCQSNAGDAAKEL